MRLLVTAVTVASLALSPVPAGPAAAATLWPVPGAVIEEFDPPYPDWLPGHRGIDLAATIDEPIRTPRAGVVQFVGSVAGTDIVVIGHGTLSATYLPAVTDLPEGAPVSAGQVIARMAAGTHCSRPCLHWGARANGRYVDPRLLLGTYEVVLTPVMD